VSTIEVSWCGTDIAILMLHGEHDLATAPALADELRRMIRAGELTIVDLSQTQFIDSSVMNNLHAAERMARERGLTLTLQLGSESIVRRALELSGLLEQLPCAASREEAIALARPNGRAEGAHRGETRVARVLRGKAAR
jgi:anti-anti-sigma factor